MYKKILIPLDNSPTDKIILEHIRPLVQTTQAALILVHVAEGFVGRLQDKLNLADSEEIIKDKSYLDILCRQLTQEGLNVKSVLVHDKEPADGILDTAKAEGCDLIAMATHGHKFVKDVILGSVADALRHRTDIPILMIRASLK